MALIAEGGGPSGFSLESSHTTLSLVPESRLGRRASKDSVASWLPTARQLRFRMRRRRVIIFSLCHAMEHQEYMETTQSKKSLCRHRVEVPSLRNGKPQPGAARVV